MENQAYQMLQKLKTDYRFYAEKCLKIKNKSGVIVPFVFNKAQRFAHAKIEEQKAKTGKVRAIIVKARQEGISTYISGRFFHETSLTPGLDAFIMAHMFDSTRHLFGMAKRFYDNAPPAIVPKIDTLNEKRMAFGGINSGYSVGTAGNAQIGRGLTIQLFHGSETAFFENTNEITTGILQAIPDAPGTEVIFESTANGVGNMFHQMAMAGIGENPEGDFITIFIPWFWQDEYAKIPPVDFEMTAEEEGIAELYSLNDHQMYWRRRKIIDTFRGDVWKFRQEYPSSVQEAFIVSGVTLLSAEQVAAARACHAHDLAAPIIIGCDPARNKDRTVIVIRRGREILKWLKYETMDEMTLAGILAAQIDKYQALKCFVDTGYGYGTIDRLKELGFGQYVTGVHFGSKAMEPDIYQNKRAEMADTVLKWFAEGGVNIPDEDEFHMDMLAVPPLSPKGSRGVLALPPKDEIIKLFGKSPDVFDALCFVAGTKILTPKGKVPIENLRVGDKVTTPFGNRTIIKTHKSKTAKLTTARFSDGSELTGKPGHKVFSFKGGLIPLDMLSLDNEIETDSTTRRVLWKINKLLFTKGKSFGFKARAITINPTVRLSRKDFCTGEFTGTTMGQSLKECTYTTKMSIGQIMKYLIWNLGLLKHIVKSIGQNILPIRKTGLRTNNISPMSESSLPSGISLRKGGNGTANTEKELGRIERKKKQNVPFVVKNTKPLDEKTASSVPGHVSNMQDTEDTKRRLVSVWNVVKSLIITSIGLKPVVPINVQTCEEEEKHVYNLTLDQDNMYYANGVLVENCLTFSFPVSSRAVQQRIKRVELNVRRPSSPSSTIRDFNRNGRGEKKIYKANVDFT
uniref:Putative terminase large subunit n=1 Tax=viral metagenome TaxID=1070528 RepID=A0A6M3IS74_9ZZZZ